MYGNVDANAEVTRLDHNRFMRTMTLLLFSFILASSPVDEFNPWLHVSTRIVAIIFVFRACAICFFFWLAFFFMLVPVGLAPNDGALYAHLTVGTERMNPEPKKIK